jgi:hypothetical protein
LDSAASDLLDADLGQLLLLFFKDLDKFSLVLVAKFVCFDSGNLVNTVFV